MFCADDVSHCPNSLGLAPVVDNAALTIILIWPSSIYHVNWDIASENNPIYTNISIRQRNYARLCSVLNVTTEH